MPCYHPIPAYRAARSSGPSSKLGIVFKPQEALRKPNGDPVMLEVPCGQCIGCRLRRSQEWAARLMHEAQLHEESAFITLTYAPEHCPQGLVKHHFQDFMKRLRERLRPRKIRFFHCGEYGERFARPHYHAIIFGFDFPDRCLYRSEESGTRLYTSAFLADCWGFGFCTVGDVTFDSAAYVARYVVKKVTGDEAEEHYWKVDEVTGETIRVPEEYVTMSRRPGIAADWFREFGKEVFPNDEVIVNGKEMKPPRYYEKMFEAAHGDAALAPIKRKREVMAERHKKDAHWRRLADREYCKERKLRELKRGYESEG